MNSSEVKELIKTSGLKCWQVADAWGLTDGNFSRKLRKPFNEDDIKKLYNIITSLKQKK